MANKSDHAQRTHHGSLRDPPYRETGVSGESQKTRGGLFVSIAGKVDCQQVKQIMNESSKGTGGDVHSGIGMRTSTAVGLSIIALLAILTIIGNSVNNQGTQPTADEVATPNTSYLNVDVFTKNAGIVVANKEAANLIGCRVGVNGGCGWGFSDPPYVTHKLIAIEPNQTITVPYESMTDEDGSRFDIRTHAANSVVVMCSMGTNNKAERSFCGGN